MSQSQKSRHAVTRLHAALQEAGVTAAELRTDHDGDLYLSVPTGYMEALEVDSYHVLSTRHDSVYFTLVRRAWDRTGGMSAELEVGETNQPHLIVAMIKADLAWLEEQADKLEAAMTAALTPEGEGN